MAQSTYGRSDTMSDLKDKASDQIKRAADTAEGVASRSPCLSLREADARLVRRVCPQWPQHHAQSP